MARLHSFIVSTSKESAKTISTRDLLDFYNSIPSFSAQNEYQMSLQVRCATQLLSVLATLYSSLAVPADLFASARQLYERLIDTLSGLLDSTLRTTDEGSVAPTATLLDAYGELHKFASWFEGKRHDVDQSAFFFSDSLF